MTAQPELQQTEEQKIRFRVRDLIAGCLREEPSAKEKMILDDRGVATIAEAVDLELGSTTLMEVVDAVLIIAHYLETELSAPLVAKRLVEIVNRTHVLDSMKQINGARGALAADRARSSAEELARVTHQRVGIEATAPPFDAEAPDGFVKLNSLAFPKRL